MYSFPYQMHCKNEYVLSNWFFVLNLKNLPKKSCLHPFHDFIQSKNMIMINKLLVFYGIWSWIYIEWRNEPAWPNTNMDPASCDRAKKICLTTNHPCMMLYQNLKFRITKSVKWNLIFSIFIWRPPSLSELISMVFNTGLTHLGSEASIWYIS